MLNSLNVAQTGLAAAKAAVENISNNIANEHTPGYKRRVINQSELPHNDSRYYGRGVSASSAYRITSSYMSQNLLRATTKEAYFNEKGQMLGDIETIFKETDESGLSKDLNAYLKAIQNLRNDPSSEIYKHTVAEYAKILVNGMKSIYSDIQKAEELTKDSMKENVNDINQILKEIGKVNEQLAKTNVASNDLLDKRDELELKLSKYVDISSEVVNGTYTLKIGNVVAIGNNTVVRDISVKDTYSPQQDRYVNSDGKTSSVLNGVTFDNQDTITYKLNNKDEVSVRYGESLDTNGDGTPDLVVDETNYVRALAFKINSDPELSKKVTAYNGTYEELPDGSKVTDDSKDNYLLIESNTPGEKGKFAGRILVTEQTNASDPSTITNKSTVYRDEYQSNDGENSVQIYSADAPINLSSGILKAQSENLTTNSPNNKYAAYKNKLDALAQTLSDITDKYVKIGDDRYVSGETSTDNYTGDQSNIRSINLFSGGTVDTLEFNEDALNNLTQEDLDYLDSIGWNENISFEGRGQDNPGKKASSFSEYYQDLRVSVSSDKETANTELITQKAVKQSVQSSYDEVVKVDKDEEMLDLIKFQAAYTANAKIVTVVDEMLQTLLGMRR
ncbi:flagellar biosynthesis protein FlgK [Malaciobacter molluscorum LMG 25693]|uniref:Flagellar hook-associated protein 1 n=1 Tax=Malaciobacter molluscorum LMG 25693 TaxID=870501 RepID=A0A2G1DH53_9BACT|nr:flagellar basal body rod C-terminal domain-containing protein [Malaciobacter molluscorum]AXX93429.1 proximal flagellar hook-filament junction protein [Malaciobacter molluscorum LMG 25693]PHO17832.1 flagellar biosynthesis protein FlgK [Malaciobacter molluscorum LMG 25693]